MKLPHNTPTRVMGKDPDRYSPARKVAWECYGHFGRRLALFTKDDSGTFWSDEVHQYRAKYGGWVRIVTY